MASRISNLMKYPGLSTAVLANDTGMWNRGFPIGEGGDIFKQILPGKFTNNIPLFVPLSIQEGKMWDALYTKFIKLLLPLCVINIQQNEIHTIPAANDPLLAFVEGETLYKNKHS